MGLAATGQAGVRISAAAVGTALKRFPWKSLLAHLFFSLLPESPICRTKALASLARREGGVESESAAADV